MSQFSPLRLVVKSLDAIASALPPHLTGTPVGDSGTTLSPLLNWMLHLRHLKNGSAELGAATPDEARRQFRADILPLRKGYAVREVRDLAIPGPAGLLPARHYQPEADGALPALLVFFHGGGFVIGDLDTHDDVCRLLCREAGLQVLSIDYRLAPEHPFPAAADDAEAATRWAQQHAADFGVAPTAIAVGGDSAGGNLAAVVAQRLASGGTPLLAQLLIYPATDMATPRASQQLFGKGFFLSFEDREWFHRTYLAGNDMLKYDVSASPLLNKTPGVLAPALVITSGFDVLRDEGEAYAEHLRATGTAVEHIRCEQLGHGFINLAGAHRDSELATERLARRFRLLCNRALALELGAASRSATATAAAKPTPKAVPVARRKSSASASDSVPEAKKSAKTAEAKPVSKKKNDKRTPATEKSKPTTRTEQAKATGKAKTEKPATASGEPKATTAKPKAEARADATAVTKPSAAKAKAKPADKAAAKPATKKKPQKSTPA